MQVSVVICTYSPVIKILKQVIEALRSQTLPVSQWQLTVIDNNSPVPVDGQLDLSWHPHAAVVRETKPGLAHARVSGVKASKAELIVFVDDDNVLTEDYLEKSLAFYQQHPQVGCFGGRSLPVFETDPPAWFAETGINLGCQDYGSEVHVSNYSASGFQVSSYPQKAPIGTGMVITKKAFETYQQEALSSPQRMLLGRRGRSLSSGEDNDIILTLVKRGFELAYVPQLVVHHLIPPNRYSECYLRKMAYESNRTWVRVLHLHGISPWRKIASWTVPPRMIKSFVLQRAWRSPLAGIQWRSACGTFKGLSEI